MEQSCVYGPTTSAVETQDVSSKDEIFESLDEDMLIPPTPRPIQRKPTLSTPDVSDRSFPRPQPSSSTDSFSLPSESNQSSSHEISVEALPIPQNLGRNRSSRVHFNVSNGSHQTVPTSLCVSSLDVPGPEIYHQFYLKAQDLLSEIKRLQFAFKTVGGAGPALMATEATWISFKQLVKLFGHNTWSLFPHYESSRIECLKGSANCSDFKMAFNEAAEALNLMDGALENFRNAYYEYRISYRLNSLHNRLKKAAEQLYASVAPTDEELRSQIQMHLTFLIKRIDMLREDLNSYCDKAIPIISSEQEVRSTRYLNLTTISTFLSAVTAIFLPISAEQPDGALNIAVNTLLFASLTFSIASAINSLLTVSWSKSIVHSPYFHLPVLANVCLNSGPMFSLITSATLFVAGLCLFVFSSGQHPVTSLMTVVFAGLYTLCLLALGAWLITEKWRFHHRAPPEVRSLMDFSLSLAVIDSIDFWRRKLTESTTPKYVSELESDIDDSGLPVNVSCYPRPNPTAVVHDRLDGYNFSVPQYIRNDGLCGGNNLDLTENSFPMPNTTADCPHPISPHVYAGPYLLPSDKIMVDGDDAVTNPNPVAFRRNAFLLPPRYPLIGEPGHFPSSHRTDYVTENSSIVSSCARTRYMPPEISTLPSDLAHVQDYSFFAPDDHAEAVHTLRRSHNILPSPNATQGYSSTPFCRGDFHRDIGPHSNFISRCRLVSLPKQCPQTPFIPPRPVPTPAPIIPPMVRPTISIVHPFPPGFCLTMPPNDRFIPAPDSPTPPEVPPAPSLDLTESRRPSRQVYFEGRDDVRSGSARRDSILSSARWYSCPNVPSRPSPYYSEWHRPPRRDSYQVHFAQPEVTQPRRQRSRADQSNVSRAESSTSISEPFAAEPEQMDAAPDAHTIGAISRLQRSRVPSSNLDNLQQRYRQTARMGRPNDELPSQSISGSRRTTIERDIALEGAHDLGRNVGRSPVINDSDADGHQPNLSERLSTIDEVTRSSLTDNLENLNSSGDSLVTAPETMDPEEAERKASG
ncbi:hypothetical protein ACEPAG_9148 [Sanghuangporus baumii]